MLSTNEAQQRAKRLLGKHKDKQASLTEKAEDHFERNFIRRFGKLKPVRRFVAMWLILCAVLIGAVVAQARALGSYYQTMQPTAGGIYHEGIVGSFTNANPLYVTGQVNDAVSKLLFSGLFTYDQRNKLVGDLAESFEVDAPGTTYTVHLRDGLSWHDGKPLTANDVAFTYRSIQNPDAQSPLNASWQNVAVTARDDSTIIFKLPNPLSSFPHSLTTGIIPEHLFKDVRPTNFRSVPFNTIKPVGSGPFRFKTIEVTGNSPSTRQEEIELVPFDKYRGGAPALSSFVIHTFPDREKLVAAFKDRTVNAMSGLQNVPQELEKDDSVRTTVMPLTAANMVFFKTTSEGPLADKTVRQALVGSADVPSLTNGLRQPIIPVREPILSGTPGYDPAIRQLDFGRQQAETLLDQQGWLKGSDGIRAKGSQKLSFKLYSQDSPEHQQVTDGLRQQWRRIGADVQIYRQADTDLRATVADHSYDALLYGISLGVDPDGFVYWHSSQSDIRSASRLNLSEYSSPVADAALEDGRTRSDPTLRALKYKPFLQAWRDDAPALGLYQPRFIYVTRGDVFNLRDHTLTTDTDRYNNVQDWMIRQAAKTSEQ